jgi:hypothetical protein
MNDWHEDLFEESLFHKTSQGLLNEERRNLARIDLFPGKFPAHARTHAEYRVKRKVVYDPVGKL